MKKLFVIVGVLVSVATISSCGSAPKENVESADSTAVKADTTVVVDSTVVAVDTVKTVEATKVSKK